MGRRGKRGLSGIIVTILLIGLSLAAVAAAWLVIRNLLAGGIGSLGLGRITIRLEIERAYQSGNNISVEVSRKAGKGELLGIVFVVSNGTDKETVRKNSNLKELESQTFRLNLSRINAASVTEVSIAPVFKSAQGEETIGDIIDTIGIGEEREGGEEGGPTGVCIPECSYPAPYCVNEQCVECLTVADCFPGEECTNNVCVPPECQPESISTTCGTWECGIKVNNCGQEVNCPPGCSGQICNNGICIDCLTAADCLPGEECTNNVCVPPECEAEPPETTCEDWVCGMKANNCGEQINCTIVTGGCSSPTPKCSNGQCVECLTDTDCALGTICDNQICKEIVPVNEGTVGDTWPGTSGMYFGSSDLPKSEVECGAGCYKLHSIRTTTQTTCLYVVIYQYPIEGYEYSHIGFNFETDIKTGDHYEIFTSNRECQRALF